MRWLIIASPLVAIAAIAACISPVLVFGVIAALVVCILGVLRPKTFFTLGMFVLLMERTISLHIGGGLVDQFDEIFVAACAVLFTLRRLLDRKSLRSLPAQYATIAFAFMGIAGAVANTVPILIASQGLLLIMKGFLLAWGVAQLDWVAEDIHRLVRRSSPFVVALIIGAGVNFLFPGPWSQVVLAGHDYGTRLGLAPVTSFFQHPGYFGTVMALSFLAAFAYVGVFGRSRTATFILLGSVASAFLTGRRKVLIGLSAAAAYLAVRFRLAWIGVASAIVIPISFILFWKNIADVIQYTWAEYFLNPDAVARIRLTIDAFTVALSNFPAGAGFGRFGSAVARQYYSPLYYQLGYDGVWGLGSTEESGQFLTDTFWPAIIGEAGLFGAALFAAIFVIYMLRFGRLAKTGNRWDRWLGLVGIAWTIELLFESIAGAVFTAVPTFALYFAVVGIAASRLSIGTASLNGAEAQSPAVAAGVQQ